MRQKDNQKQAKEAGLAAHPSSRSVNPVDMERKYHGTHDSFVFKMAEITSFFAHRKILFLSFYIKP
ncbi:hypothetical protein [Kordiimonas marina]|uniref:hypothetical protein n=1 Tax=Kordiimonas marina TaxID=2872312 RepID=UPI001FF52D81|nr:hypothetical protein [Kordiimonas marina]MCJ9427531.1 hypothetical protein [Kordiimonas marina]